MARILRALVIVAQDVHSYDAFARTPYPSQIPPMRSPYESVVSPNSSTPIYDALYAEWRRLFRALPFDRTGEEPFLEHSLFRGWPPSGDQRPAQGGGRHREGGLPALPPGPSAARDNRMRGL